MTGREERSAGRLVLLAVGCGIAVQLSLIRLSVVLVHPAAAFPTLAAHIAGWGIGLGVGALGSGWIRHPSIPAAAASAVAWIGLLVCTAPELRPDVDPRTAGIVLVALTSAFLTGTSIAGALAWCRSPLVALAADLGGVGLGAASHVALGAAWPAVPTPLIWVGLLALSAVRTSLAACVGAGLLGAVLLVPVDGPDALAQADTPLARALKTRGLAAWKGTLRDVDGRVDAVFDGEGGGFALYINGATQAQTPRKLHDRTTTAILDLVRPRSALVLGAGGMADVATLLDADIERVVAVERSDAVLRSAAALAPETRHILEDARVRVIRAEARRFVAGGGESFDLIVLPLAYASAGVSPAALTLLPTYVFTVEGIEAQGRRASPRGAVCFVLPGFDLRDRVLSTIGRIEMNRGTRGTLPQRLWVAENPGETAYSQAVCWAPHAPLAMTGRVSDLQLLHHPAVAPSAPLLRRLDGIDTLAPVSDRRPYFFDLFSLRPGGGQLPPFVWNLFPWTAVSVLISALGLARLRSKSDRGHAPPPKELGVAWLTGLAFPALEYLLLSIARAAGFSDGMAYVLAAVIFASAGLVAMHPRGSVEQRALLSIAAMVCMAMFFELGGLTRLFAIEPVRSAACGLAIMAVAMVAGIAPFVRLFRTARSRAARGADVRSLFVASALGTLAGTAPVLAVELRWGGGGSALLAAFAYSMVFFLTVRSRAAGA